MFLGLAHDRWLRGDSYDLQRQAYGSAAGAKVGLLHRFIVIIVCLELKPNSYDYRTRAHRFEMSRQRPVVLQL